MNNPQMPALLVSHRRPGFYFRVIEEGEIGAGDEITRVAEGPERVSVAEVDALLYLPGHPRDQLQRALRIPALSAGWKGSLQALAAADEQAGNAGLAPSSAPPPAWVGFRPLRVKEVRQECVDVLSFDLESVDDVPLPLALPGQFLVFKVEVDKDSGPLLRSYSISGRQNDGTYRISVKRSTGAGSRYFHDSLRGRRPTAGKCAQGQLHTCARQESRSFDKRGYRGYAGTFNALRASGERCRL